MKLLCCILLIGMTPLISHAEIYSWTDSKGVVNYTSDPKNLPESVRKSIVVPAQPETRSSSSEKKKNREENSKKFVEETMEKIRSLTRQIESGIRYVDEYHEKNRSVSKYVLISTINSMSYEIKNLLEMCANSPLTEDVKKSVRAQTIDFEKKYSEFNRLINDFDSIEVSSFKSDKQIDYKTTRSVDGNYQTSYNYFTGTYNRNIDTNTLTSYTITEENYIFTFSATVSNSGSKADIAVELKGLNYQGTAVASHVMRTSIGSDSSKEIGDRIVLARGAGQDISRWEIADVKIQRTRK